MNLDRSVAYRNINHFSKDIKFKNLQQIQRKINIMEY